MADDVDDHSMEIEVMDTDTFTIFFRKVINIKYFPCVIGNDVVWALTCRNDDLVSWLTKENQIYTRFVTKYEPMVNSNDRWNGQSILFKYYSPRIKRAKYIFDIHHGNNYHIWHEGFMPEYKAYGINKAMEKEWMNNKR